MDAPTPQTELHEKQHSLVSRALVAAAFSWVGAKISFLAMVADANAVLGGEKMSLGEKFRSSLNGKLWQQLKLRIAQVAEKKHMSGVGATASVLKYTTISTAIGMAAGGALGWARGGRINDWKDILKHPVQSTKLIFGGQNPQSVAADFPEKESPEILANEALHALAIEPRMSHADGIAQVKTPYVGRA